MQLLEWMVVLLAVSLVLSTIARKLSVPYPALLALGGAALGFVPGAPSVELDPHLTLALFVAPVLLDSAFDTSLRDLKDNFYPIAGLVVAAVGLTVLAVALVAHALVPGLPWGAAIALGAVVAPPDAAAAIAALRELRPPHRVMTILEGESLLNDGTALVIYRVAVTITMSAAAQVGHTITFGSLGIVGGLLLGPLLALGTSRVIGRIRDPATSIVTQFVATFSVWLIAEHLQLSAVLTMVSYAITLSRYSPARMPARLRFASFAVWDTVVLLLNVLAFALVGLQTGPTLQKLDAPVRAFYLQTALWILLTVIVTRFVWVMINNVAVRWRIRRYGFHPPRPMAAPTRGAGIVISWCGMRGIVTLASALALPIEFPFRDLVLVTASVIVLGTLVVQGFTLPPLFKLLQLTDDDPIGREVRDARTVVYRAALAVIEGDGTKPANILRWELQEVLRQSEKRGELDLPIDDLRRKTAHAARQALERLRSNGTIGDDAYHSLHEEFDAIEFAAREPS